MKRLLAASALMHLGLFATLRVVAPRELRAPAAPVVRGLDVEVIALTPTPAPAPITPPPTPPPAPTPTAPARLTVAPPPPRVAPPPFARVPLPSVPPRVAVAALAMPALPAPALAAPVLTAPAPALAAPARVDVGSLFARAPSSDLARAGLPLSAASESPAAVAERRETAARAATQGYVQGLLADANTSEPSQLHAYYGAVARRMRETWRPGFYRTPDMVDALMAVPRRVAQYARRYSARASTFTLTGRPDDPAAPLIPTDFEDRSSSTTRTTVSIVEVEQDDTGRVTSMRVVRHARVRDFDEAALEAVRAAFPQQQPVPVPGGRRSRWSFEVAASRDAIVPVAGLSFNESNGFFEMHYPGALHVRTRVRPIGSRPLAVPWPLPQRPAE